MSADNWGICPKCNRTAVESLHRLDCEIQQAYGNIPEQDYLALLQEQQQPIALEQTLREDYWVLMDEDGKFCVSYKCHCNVCGFSYKFEKDEQVLV